MEVSKQQLMTIDASQFGVEKSKAKQLEAIFAGFAKKMDEFREPFSDIIQEAEKEVTPELARRAKRLRLDIARAVRIPTEKARKEEKADIVRRGKAIDGLANIIKDASYDFENPLKKIEDHAEIQEQKRIEALQAERVELISMYVEDAHERDLSGMDEDVWSAYLSMKKHEYEERIQAEKKAEQERLERERLEKLLQTRKDEMVQFSDFFDWNLLTLDLSEDEYQSIKLNAEKSKNDYLSEQERIKKENLRLQKEKEEAEEKAESERKAREEAEKKQRQYRERIEAEVKAKVEAERKEREEAEERDREAAIAPEKVRLVAWVDSFALPELPGERHDVCDEIEQKFASFKKWANSQIKEI